MKHIRPYSFKTSPGRQLLVCVLLGLFIATPYSVEARQTEVDGTPIASDVYSSFQSNYRRYAVFINELEGGFAVIPNYDRRLASSRGISVTQAMDRLKVEQEVRNGNLVQNRVKYPDRADAEAYSRALPNLNVGSYGWVASAEVVKIIDREQMIVKDIWLIDRPKVRAEYEKDRALSARENGGEENKELLKFNYAQRIKMVEQQEDRDEGFQRQFRLVGYDTRGLRVGDRWKGLNDEGFQVGVAMWEEPEPAEDQDKRRSRRENDPRLVLTELESLMRKSINEQGFKELLADRGMTVVGFVDLVRTLRDEDRRNAEERIINALLPPEVELDD